MIGASPRPEAIGGIVFRNILAGDFKGAAYPVNRSGEPVAGRARVRVDRGAARAGRPRRHLPARRACPGRGATPRSKPGVRALCVISAGFAEIGEEGRERQEQLLALVRAHGGRLVGPNCLGIAVSAPSLNATFGPRALPPGPIAFSSQSGALGLALLEKASERSLGFSSFISIGNKADVSSNDLLEYWEEDRRHRADRALPRVVRQPAPVRADRGPRRAKEADPRDEERHVDRGSTGRRLAHRGARRLGRGRRGALPPGRRAARTDARGADRRGGAALDAAAAARPKGRHPDECRRPRHPLRGRVRDGGPGALRAHARDETQLAELLPAEASLANPVDMLGSATAASYEAVLPVVLADPAVDSVIVLFVPPAHARAPKTWRRGLVRTLEAVLDRQAGARGAPQRRRDSVGPSHDARAGRALHVSRVGGAGSRPRRRARGVAAPARGRRPLRRRDRRCRGRREHRLERAGRPWLTPAETRELLDALRPAARRRTGRGDASSRPSTPLESSGSRSSSSPAVAGAHKTETGGVALDLADEDRRPRSGRAHRRAGHRPADGRGRHSSSSRASSRTRRSARSSRSGPAESSRS